MHNICFYNAVHRVFLCLAICLGGVGQVWAHAQAETQSPAAGTVINATNAPKEVRITFDAALEPAFSSVVVSDAQGKQVNSAKTEVDSATHKTMRVALPVLPAGKYQVKWVAVADDGHRTQGSYSFTVK